VIIRFFKSSFFIQYFFIALIGFSLWTGAFLTPVFMPVPEGPVPLYGFIYGVLHDFPRLASLLAFILILFEAYGFTQIFSRHEMVQKNASLPALIFVVLMSLLPEMLTLNPVNLVLGLMIIIVHHLLIYYNKPDHLDRIFAAGFFTSIGGFIYVPFLIWFLFIIISFLVFRAGSWRAWLASFIGLITPYLYLFTWYFWWDELLVKIRAFLDFFGNLLVFPTTLPIYFWITTGFTALIGIWGFIRYQTRPHEKTVEVRAKTSILLWTLVFTAISYLFAGAMILYHILLAIPALTMILSVELSELKKTRPAEVILTFYYLIILANNLLIHHFFYP